VSFRRRLALSCAVAVAVAVVLGSVGAYLLVRGTLLGQIDASLREQVTMTGAIAPEPERDRLLQGGPQVVKRSLVTRREQPLPEPLGRDPELEAVARGERPPFLGDRVIAGERWRVLVTRGEDGVALFVARPLGEVESALARLRIGLGLLALAGIGLAALLAWLATRTAVRPVVQLTETAEHVAATRDLSRRIEAHGEDEISRLAASFNTMLEALEQSQRAQRQLVADASHELRTPLTSLRTNLEVLARGGPPDPADRDRLRHDLIAQLEELTALVGDLIELAREDEPGPAPVERARRHAPGVRFTTRLEPALVQGVPARLDRAVANLLDNAAKWSPPGGTVEVALLDGDLTVCDHGPGIAPEDRPHVFDRFFRADVARGRPGSGLGLAIVRQVAESHGGSVAAEGAEGGGALLRLRLPVLSANS
jgi:two-component system sensor histidine kinase MprB